MTAADEAAANLRAELDRRRVRMAGTVPAVVIVPAVDLRTLLDEREQLVTRIAELEAELANVLCADGSADYSSGDCEGCGCCSQKGCHRFADATCPTDSLGDSVCPCTED